jgi:ribonuclease HII
MLVCGVDDAGRGAVVGPLLIAGVLISRQRIQELKEIGVKDSKLITPNRRQKLYTEIIGIVEKHNIVTLSPKKIDEVVETGSKLHRLNRLEAHAMAQVISSLRPEVAYVDASDVLPKRFGEHIAEVLPFFVRIVSEHKADKTYPVVSAASIIAKVERDNAIAKLKEKYGDLGSGYVSDPKTIEFLRQWMQTHVSYPDFIRKSWKPAKRIKANYSSLQKKLF